jgi:putative flippase GtrA
MQERELPSEPRWVERPDMPPLHNAGIRKSKPLLKSGNSPLSLVGGLPFLRDLPCDLMKVLFGQLIRFGLIGVLASVIHYIFAIGLVHAGSAPLRANFLAFIIAFQVSFFGHFKWSFKSANPELGSSMKRFSLVAILGFTMNECSLWALLRWSDLSVQVSLAAVLITVAGLTFLLSRIWAFESK